MEPIFVPDYFYPNNPPQETPNISFHIYENRAPVDRAKISLRCNVLSFITEGKKQLAYEDRHAEVEPSEFILMKAGNCLMTEKTSVNQKYKSFMICFSNLALQAFIEKYGILLKKENQSPPFLVLRNDSQTEHYPVSIDLLLNSPKHIPQAMLELKFEEIMLYLFSNYPKKMLSFFSHSNAIENGIKFKRIVESNLSARATVEELAFLCNLSLSSFKRKFVEIYGATPGNWMQQQRLEKAAHLLASTDKRASDLWLETGFESQSSFTQAFKKKFGTTPKKFQSTRS